MGEPAVPGMQAAPPSVQDTRRPLQFAAAAQQRQAQPSFNDAFAAARAEQGAGGTFEHVESNSLLIVPMMLLLIWVVYIRLLKS